MVKKLLIGLALLTTLYGCTPRQQKIRYLGAFKKDNSIYYKLNVEGEDVPVYLIDHGTNSLGRKNTEGYIFPRESREGTNLLQIQFINDQDGQFDEIRFIRNEEIYRNDNYKNRKILTERILQDSRLRNALNWDTQKLFNIENSDPNSLDKDSKMLMNSNDGY
ncbi:MAG: hypothetical protein ACOYT4_03450 [Nanoarchaeota archaeon]